jgi:hypothetical protein
MMNSKAGLHSFFEVNFHPITDVANPRLDWEMEITLLDGIRNRTLGSGKGW